MAPKTVSLKSRVYSFYRMHMNLGKLFTVNHFREEGMPKATIYRMLNDYEKGLPAERKPGSGRKAKKATPKMMKQLTKAFDGSDKISIRQAASKFGISKSWLHEALCTKTAIRYRKKQAIPSRTDKQIALAKTKCSRMIRKFSGRAFVLDDESYFTLSHSSIGGNDGFYTSDVRSASATVKFSRKKKFESKVLVWIAIGPKGLSRPLIRKSGFAINQHTYLCECIRRRLIPYIRASYRQGEYVFWPDQASSHYAGSVKTALTAENIDFVQQADNPSNVPEIRVIEDFWACLKALVYKNGWKAENCNQLITRIKYCLKKVDERVVQRLAVSTKMRIDRVRRKGVIETR